MRCAIDFNENEMLQDQKVRAWGEMQSTQEEPASKEEDIKSESAKNFCHGYKCALDDVCSILSNMEKDDHDINLKNAGSLFEDTITKSVSEHIQDLMAGELCMQLFAILDDEYCDED